MKIIYLNIKPQSDNWDNMKSIGFSVGATYDSVTKDVMIYEEKDAKRLIRLLLSSDLVVTFNGHRFDYPVLSAYTDKDLFAKTKSFHILENVEGSLWQRLSLSNLARQNLNKTHTTHVMHQIRLHQGGMIRTLKKIVEYDLNSVIELFKLGCERKFLNYWCPDEYILKSFRTDSWAKDCKKLTFAAKNYRK